MKRLNALQYTAQWRRYSCACKQYHGWRNLFQSGHNHTQNLWWSSSHLKQSWMKKQAIIFAR